MKSFEAKSEGSRRGRKYANLLDELEDENSDQDFKMRD